MVEIVFFNSPIGTVTLAYPILRWKHRQWQQLRVNEFTAKTITGTDITYIVRQSQISSEHCRISVSSTPHNWDWPSRYRQHQTKFAILLGAHMLTCCVVIFWTPYVSFCIIKLYDSVNFPLLYQIGQVLWSIEPAIDPILFSVAVKDLRVALWTLVKRKS